MSARREAKVALASAASALATVALVRARPPAEVVRWQRRNYRGKDVDLFGGPAAAAGALVAAATTSGRRGAVLVTAVAAGLGAYDDLAGDRHARGLGGHARELRAGRLTTGVVKLAGLGSVAAAVAGLRRRRGADLLIDTGLVAGTANLVNLLDLRPGRALKIVAIAAAPMLALDDDRAAVAAGVVGTAATLLPDDLRERSMLGDCGANSLGALLGWLVAGSGRMPRRLVLAGVVGLTLASERVSFTQVIDRTPALARLDAWGRRAA